MTVVCEARSTFFWNKYRSKMAVRSAKKVEVDWDRKTIKKVCWRDRGLIMEEVAGNKES